MMQQVPRKTIKRMGREMGEWRKKGNEIKKREKERSKKSKVELIKRGDR